MAGNGDTEHLGTVDNLDAFTTFVFAQGAFVGVQAKPSVPCRARDLLGGEELQDRVLARACSSGQAAFGEVGEQLSMVSLASPLV